MAASSPARRPPAAGRSAAGRLAAAALLLPALLRLAWRPLGGAVPWRAPAPRAFATPRPGDGPGRPSAGDLLQAFGRELWVIGDELLTVSARIQAGASLGGGGIALRNAADMMLTGEWEDVMGELETAAVSCAVFLPYERFEGLVNLFSYYEPMPDWEWAAARKSLLDLSEAIDEAQMDLLRNLEGTYRAETADSITFVVERLRKSANLFEPATFYMPPQDPRDKVDREGRGKPRMPEARPFPWGQGPRDEAAYRASLVQQTLRREAQVAAEAAGGRAPVLLAEVDRELEAAAAMASPAQARRAALRKLLRDLHPDRTTENQADVRPAFEYIVKLRDEEK